MEGYRRFISYMYLYEDGRKTINSGFVRVESRDGKCRISVHMTGTGSSEEHSCRAYMLIRDSEDYTGIALGNLTIQKQAGDMTLTMDSEHLAGSEYNLDCITGIVLLDEAGKIYGTRWDDAPLETEKLTKIRPLSGSLVQFGSERHADENPLIQEAEPTVVQTQSANTYEQLLTQLPQMYPFDDDSIGACVRLELQDIGRMPVSCWNYGSNSFLLHGYYCYRHLILAKTDLRDGKQGAQPVYLIGVPGIWQHREQYMAAMFGFRNFKPVSRENQESGAFGYWCAVLKV